jgi:hypothetical protein
MGRQPYAARRFLLNYQDREMFGTDTARDRAGTLETLHIKHIALLLSPRFASGDPHHGVQPFSVLSERSPMSCRQAEQPVGGGLTLFLGAPGAHNRTDFLAQQRATPRPPLVRVARTA